MAIYDWPSSRTFTPQTAELRVIDNTQRALESPMSGYVQTLSMPGARWGWGFDFGVHADADRDALEAYLLRLSGREHRVRLWDLKRPRPRGSIQTTGVTLAATAAQFATTLQLGNCRGGNHLLGGSFEVDTSGDGIADGWTRFSSGATGTLSAGLLFASGTEHGSYRQFMAAAALGADASSQQGVRQAGVSVAHLAGQPIMLACSAAATTGTGIRLFIEWYNGTGVLISTNDSTATATGSVQTVSHASIAPTNAVTATVYVWQQAGTGAAAELHIDVVRLLPGSNVLPYPATATLLAGDWLRLANGQLVRVVADAVADDLGRMTVDVRHMLRSSVASGSAVTLDKPTALFVRTEAGLMLPRMPGLAAPPMSAEFVEVFA